MRPLQDGTSNAPHYEHDALHGGCCGTIDFHGRLNCAGRDNRNVVRTEEVDMRKRVLALTASAVVVAFGVFGPIAQAQGPTAPDPGFQQSPADNQDRGFMMGRGGMMGHGVLGHGMMSGGMMGGGMMGHGRGGGTAPMMMRMIFSLMDADGDGKLSLQEFQAAHERIFKAMDTNKDGFVTLEEMQNFIRGTSTPAPQQ